MSIYTLTANIYDVQIPILLTGINIKYSNKTRIGGECKRLDNCIEEIILYK